MSKFVSIIVPCFNQAQYLPETLQSVLDQTYTHWECIIVNDGSPDNTEEIALEWSKKDKRFIYLKKENGGLSSARNAGLNIAKGDFIQFLDSDDYIHLDKIKQSIEAINNNPNLKLVVTNFKIYSNSINKTIEPYCILSQEKLSYESVLFGWGGNFTIPIHCGLFHRNTIIQFGFDENFKAIEDWILWLNFFKETNQAIYIDNPLAYYRFHSNGMTKNNELMQDSLLKAYIKINDTLSYEYSKKFSNIIFDRLNSKINLLNNQIQDLEFKNNNYLKIMIKTKLMKMPIIRNFIK